LVRALAAAVIGRMEKLPTIFAASVVLGVLEAAVIFHTGRGIIIDPILFVIVLGALLLQRRGETIRKDERSSWQAAAEVRAIHRELANVPEVKWGRRGLLGLLVAGALLLSAFMAEGQ